METNIVGGKTVYSVHKNDGITATHVPKGDVWVRYTDGTGTGFTCKSKAGEVDFYALDKVPMPPPAPKVSHAYDVASAIYAKYPNCHFSSLYRICCKALREPENANAPTPAKPAAGESIAELIAAGHLPVAVVPRKHSHYFKDVSQLKEVDVYRVLDLFGVTDQAVGHAIKKLLCPGQRGSKDNRKDIQEAVDTLLRRLEMWSEDDGR